VDDSERRAAGLEVFRDAEHLFVELTEDRQVGIEATVAAKGRNPDDFQLSRSIAGEQEVRQLLVAVRDLLIQPTALKVLVPARKDHPGASC
jgi:hypothetical protein